MADKKKEYTVRGTITDLQGNPLKGLTVRAYDQDPKSSDDPLGITHTDSQGNYIIFFSQDSFRPEGHESSGPEVYIKIYRGKKLIGTSEVKRDADRDTTINLRVDHVPPKLDATISGHVVGADLRGVKGLTVIALDKNLDEDIFLGDTLSGERGTFEIQYASADLEKHEPDIQIQIFDDKGKKLAQSTIRYDASLSEHNFNVRLSAENTPHAPEYTRLINEIDPYIRNLNGNGLNQRLATLREDKEQQDISYLANKTGWDARMVAMASLASRYSHNTKNTVEAPFYYALFRAGVPANDAVLNQLSPEIVEDIWKRAVKEGILPQDLSDKIHENLECFVEQSAQRLLDAPSYFGVSSFKDVVAISIVDESQQEQVANLYYQQGNDLPQFWKQATEKFGDDVVRRLQLDGKLNFLTINNVPLIQRLHSKIGRLQNPIDLVQHGFYQADLWLEMLNNADGESIINIPNEIPGETLQEKQQNYADLMANQLRISYPTTVIGDMVQKNIIPLSVDDAVRDDVVQFINNQTGHFELGIHPVERFITSNKLNIAKPVLDELKRLQRVYQISPTDAVMEKLIKYNFNSAHDVVKYDEVTFIQEFKAELGGETLAHMTYAKAHQVNHAVMNIATNYLLEKTASPLYILGDTVAASQDSGVLAYPTLEGLFGELDYCACEHCRSWLSPAAYLVDLLIFLEPPGGKDNPLEVLLGRRPDIQHLQLSCENTNVVLPYIDLVNEVLEHYVINQSLDDFKGFNVEKEITSEELLASPQFVDDAAYTTLQSQFFPLPLPFHQPLEALRRYFGKFDVPLYQAMETLRISDQFAGEDNLPRSAYGWREILMERLQISRPEYRALTDANLTLHELYGENVNVLTLQALLNKLSGAKDFADKLKLKYQEIIDLTLTRFINPHSHLIRKLEALRINITQIIQFLDGNIGENDLTNQFPADLDETAYGGDVVEWLQTNAEKIRGFIVLADIDAAGDLCSFADVKFKYANGDKLRPIEFVKLIRFIRLWHKLGWNISQTDKAITALYPDNQYPLREDDFDTAIGKLENGFKTFLLRLANLSIVMEQLDLKPNRDLIALLACWNVIDNHGYQTLYRKMFLNPTILELDDVFKDDGYGNYLADKREFQANNAVLPKISEHIEALLAAFNLSREDYNRIIADLAYNDDTVLNLANISAIYRYSYLARALRYSIQDFIALKELSGLNPFAPLDVQQAPNPGEIFGHVRPAIIRFIELAQTIKQSPFKISHIRYLLQHIDATGSASPPEDEILAFAKTLRDELLRINQENIVEDDPTGDIARAKMTLVYGKETSDIFFGLLNNTSIFSTNYNHPQSRLGNSIAVVSDRLTYDNFQKKLHFQGVMTDTEKQAYDSLNLAAPFNTAIQNIYDEGRTTFANFFGRFPTLRNLYESFVDSNESLKDRMSDLLAEFLPELRTELKQQRIRQILSSELRTELDLVTALLENADLLLPENQNNALGVQDFTDLEIQGLSADIYFADDVIGVPDARDIIVETLDYGVNKIALPLHPAGANIPISGVWHTIIEAPENGFYNLYLETSADAVVTLLWDGAPLQLSLNNGVWQNQAPLELKAGRHYTFKLIVKKVLQTLYLQWETKAQGRILLPPSQLYPAATVIYYRNQYLRLLKVLNIVDKIKFTSDEFIHFAGQIAYQIGGKGWLNHLPVVLHNADVTTHELLNKLTMLIQYDKIKSDMRIRDKSLVDVLSNPAAVDRDNIAYLHRVTGWQDTDRDYVLTHFGMTLNDLKHFRNFKRIYEVFQLVKNAGIGAKSLIDSTTNDATSNILLALQAALRARYEQNVWLQVIQPINNELRSAERDALVAYVLHILGKDNATRHINTADKLFEYFLIDVQMDPCMKTSRIKQAISSVQLFIQRCLLNLEPEVKPSSINAEYWKWMNRYRVWEANRKIFLYPENWLEPELRDNKSPFFCELESDLLQGDITEDAAASAIVNYLKKLDEVAQLEICGMFYEENEANNLADDTVHVIARTAGSQRTYYYRKQEKSVSWTAWEKIDLKIEDNPIIPVMWKGRLFLFWLTIIQDPPQDTQSDSQQTHDFTKITTSQLRRLGSNTDISVSAALYYSEYIHGKWQPPRTSNLNSPTFIGKFAPGAFARSKLSLFSSISDESLVINLRYPDKQAHSFTLYNTYSAPLSQKELLASGLPMFGTLLLLQADSRSFAEIQAPFKISYQSNNFLFMRDTDEKIVLENGFFYKIVAPNHFVSTVFRAPFFYQDRRHTFYVTTKTSSITVGDFNDIFVSPAKTLTTLQEIPTWIRPDFPIPNEDVFEIPVGLNPTLGIGNPVSELFIRERNPNLIVGLNSMDLIQFGENQIGANGLVIHNNMNNMLPG